VGAESGVVIVGAGGHGRGILEILRAQARARGVDPAVGGFLDDDEALWGRTCGGVPIRGGLETAARLASEGHLFLVGVGEPAPRREVAERLSAEGARFATAVHPDATLYGDVEVGPGTVVAAGVVVAASTRLVAHNLLNLSATLGHDCVLEEFATVAPGANLGGGVRMGKASFVGLNGTVIPGLSLGEGARLGAGSVLLEDLPAGRVAFGVPARVVDRSGNGAGSR
jgi:sugar O-acyltransferase (sialic acid O-acetyltransferase NeuD family)